MSVEALVEAIGAEAEAEAARLLRDADATVAARIAAAEAAARARVDAALAAEEPAILAEEARILNEARLRLVALRTARQAAGAAAAFDLAERRLARIAEGSGGREAGRWAAAVRRLVAETAALVGAGELRVRPADLAVARAAIAAVAGAAVSVVADPGMPAGVTGRSADGRVTVDATIGERLRRARTTLVPEVAARLRQAAVSPAPGVEAAGGPEAEAAAEAPVGARA